MQILSVLTQYNALTKPFTYYYEGDDVVKGVRVLTTINRRKIVGYVVSVTSTNETLEEASKRLGLNLVLIDEVLDTEPILTPELFELSELVSSYYMNPHITVLQAMLPPSLRPLKSALTKPKIAYEYIVKIARKLTAEDKLTPKQQAVYDEVLISERVVRKTQNAGQVDSLVKRGIFQLEEVEKSRLKLDLDIRPYDVTLTNDQENAVNAIYNGSKETYLLHGVTGSGKTEVYLHLAKKYVANAQTVIILVPEIALTKMMIERFFAEFGNDIAIFHSELTPAEKYDEYRKIAQGKIKVVVGARSAIFVPLTNIGLIVIDEEHAESYKQNSMPFYHATTVAQMRAKSYNAKVVLGSATPLLETIARAKKDVYGYVELKKRINETVLPHTTVVDMFDLNNVHTLSPFISKQLFEGLTDVLNNKEQAIILLNRRGYAPYVTCRECGATKLCPQCGISLAYHKADNTLKCHNCATSYKINEPCGTCQGTYFRFSGFGTQKAVEDLEKLFPSARILRLDSDVAKKRDSTYKVLEAFRNAEADFLVGTQMVAKGHDFPLVSLVGILNADAALAFPSFRAAERTFQLITQAIGRSGRDKISGRAIIQTLTTNHYVIDTAKRQDYLDFAKREMYMRKLSHNPPYYFLISLTFSHANESTLLETILTLKKQLENVLGSDAEVVGPIPKLYMAFGQKVSKSLIIKHQNYFKIKPHLLKLLHPFRSQSSFDVKIDVDPVDA